MLGIEMLHQHKRHPTVRRHVGEERGERLQPTSRRTDPNDERGRLHCGLFGPCWRLRQVVWSSHHDTFYAYALPGGVAALSQQSGVPDDMREECTLYHNILHVVGLCQSGTGSISVVY